MFIIGALGVFYKLSSTSIYKIPLTKLKKIKSQTTLSEIHIPFHES